MAVEEASSSGGEEGSGSGSGSGGWTREQEKAFENAVAAAGEEAPEGDAAWEEMAAAVEGKTAEEVRRHYELLVEDVDGIESGQVRRAGAPEGHRLDRGRAQVVPSWT